MEQTGRRQRSSHPIAHGMRPHLHPTSCPLSPVLARVHLLLPVLPRCPTSALGFPFPEMELGTPPQTLKPLSGGGGDLVQPWVEARFEADGI